MKSLALGNKFRLFEFIRKTGRRYLERHSRISREVIRRPGGWRCLDLIYGNDPDCLDGAGAFKPKGYFDRMFFFSTAAEATRNRLKEFIKILRNLLEKYRNESVEILASPPAPGEKF